MKHLSAMKTPLGAIIISIKSLAKTPLSNETPLGAIITFSQGLTLLWES